MGKSSKKSASKVEAAAVVAAPTKPLKKGKREAEADLEKKLASAKKQKVIKKVETSSSEEDSSDSEQPKPEIHMHGRKMSERNSKDLLHLETNTGLESKLLVCKESSLPKNPVHRPAMFPVPKSQVLGKVKDFLGIMAESNKKLMAEAKNNPDSCDIEVLSGKESEYIEMDLMLGVADLHTAEAVAAAESALAGNPPAFPFAESNSDSETGDSSDDYDKDNDGKDEAPSKSVANDEKRSSCKPAKKQNQEKRSRIVELP